MKALKLLSLFGLLLLIASCDFGLPTGGGTGGEGLTGVIVDPQGRPAVRAMVRITAAHASDSSTTESPDSVPYRDSTLTDKRGRYNFHQLPIGIYDLEASILSGDTLYRTRLPGVVFDGGSLNLGEQTLIPASWGAAGLLGYHFYLPPETEPPREEDGRLLHYTVGTSYADIENNLFVAVILNGFMAAPGHKAFPGYEQREVKLDSGIIGKMVSYPVPLSEREWHGNAAYYGWLEMTRPGESAPELVISFSCQTADNFERGLMILRSLRKWTGPGPGPVTRPGRPVPGNPSPLGEDNPVIPVFAWTGTGSGAPVLTRSYRVQVTTDTLIEPQINDAVPAPGVLLESQAMQHVSSVTLAPQTTYWWRVIALGAGGETPSAWQMYRTGSGTENPSLSNLALTLSVETDDPLAQEPDAWSRIVYILTSGAAMDSVVRDTVFAGSGQRLADVLPLESEFLLRPLRTWTLNVTVEDAAGVALLSGASTVPNLLAGEVRPVALTLSDIPFTTPAPNPPAKRTLVAPENQATGVSLTPTLSWKAIDMNDGGTHFRVQVFAAGPDPVMVLSDSVHRSSSSRDAENYLHAVGPLTPGATYSWRVLAWNAIPRVPGDTSVSETWKFTTTTAP